MRCKNKTVPANRDRKKIADRSPPEFMLLKPSARDGFGLLSRLDADEASVTALILELDDSSDQREKSVVFALAHVDAGLVLGAALANQDGSGVHEFAAETLYAEALTVRIAAVGRGAAAFLMCHGEILLGFALKPD
jgi:hypothetical protein